MQYTATYAGTASASDLSALLHSVTSLTVAETGGTNPVRVYLRNGSATGDVYAIGTAPASSSVTVPFSEPVYFPLGVYVNVITTAPFTGSVRYAVTGR